MRCEATDRQRAIFLKTLTYTEMSELETFEDRYRYLKLGGAVGRATFGHDRYINQNFYRSPQWRHLRSHIIMRDDGCDLGVPGYDLHQRIYIHHMNPMTVEDLISGSPDVLDPEFLICVSHRTHNAIHYGDESLLPSPPVERQPGDTKLW